MGAAYYLILYNHIFRLWRCHWIMIIINGVLHNIQKTKYLLTTIAQNKSIYLFCTHTIFKQVYIWLYGVDCESTKMDEVEKTTAKMILKIRIKVQSRLLHMSYPRRRLFLKWWNKKFRCFSSGKSCFGSLLLSLSLQELL